MYNVSPSQQTSLHTRTQTPYRPVKHTTKHPPPTAKQRSNRRRREIPSTTTPRMTHPICFTSEGENASDGESRNLHPDAPAPDARPSANRTRFAPAESHLTANLIHGIALDRASGAEAPSRAHEIDGQVRFFSSGKFATRPYARRNRERGPQNRTRPNIRCTDRPPNAPD